jgi:DNA polymerase epsilon subunit 2
MEDPSSTPRPPPPLFNATPGISKDQLFSSSPAFATPAYPIQSRPAKPILPFAPHIPANVNSAILPILLPQQTLRPVAFRTLTKKHNLTVTSSGLGQLSSFVGKFCGSGWREDGLAEKVLDEIAKTWKRSNGGVLVEDGPDKKLTSILKDLESCMSGGRLDTGRLSRTNSNIGMSSLSRQNSSDIRPNPNREDSQTSLGFSTLGVDDDVEILEEAETNREARGYMKVVSAFSQPRLVYSTSKKNMEIVTTPASLFPPISHKVALFRNRYNLVHQRLMRNESFQVTSFTSTKATASLMRSGSNAASIQQAYKITPISNLLGRSGTSHLLLGLLVNSATGDLAIADLSGSVVLDLANARPVPEDGAWFCPGMIVLIDGTYEEDGSNNSNLGGAGGVGGQIKGRFLADTIAGPPAERRDSTLGTAGKINLTSAHTSVGAGFGWVDFLGVGSEKAIGTQMRRVQKRVLDSSAAESDDRSKRRKVAMMGECHLDSPRTLEAIRAILASYNASGEVEDHPLSIVMMGNFVSAASMAGSVTGGGSIEYKEHFDALASVLTEFPSLLASTSLVFVPGDNDPWASAFSAGAATAIPRESVPEIFTSRIRRAIATANTDAGRKDQNVPGEAVWTSNPARMTLFGPAEEIVLFRDDITGRLRRSAVTFFSTGEEAEPEPNGQETDGEAQPTVSEEEAEVEPMEIDIAVQEATSHLPKTSNSGNANSADTATARKLVKTVLDQGHLAPFPLATRPVLWDYGSALNLYPLPTALVLADAEAPSFAITYEGCHVMNPGRVIDELGKRKGIARWVEYDVMTRRGAVRDVRF